MTWEQAGKPHLSTVSASRFLPGVPDLASLSDELFVVRKHKVKYTLSSPKLPWVHVLSQQQKNKLEHTSNAHIILCLEANYNIVTIYPELLGDQTINNSNQRLTVECAECQYMPAGWFTAVISQINML